MSTHKLWDGAGRVLLCRCGRAGGCGLAQTPPVLDEIDLIYLWLPVGYTNRIEGAEFLAMSEGTSREEPALYADRGEAALAYLKHMQPRNPRPGGRVIRHTPPSKDDL